MRFRLPSLTKGKLHLEQEERVWGWKIRVTGPGSCRLARYCRDATCWVVDVISLEAYTTNPLRPKEKHSLILIQYKNSTWVDFRRAKTGLQRKYAYLEELGKSLRKLLHVSSISQLEIRRSLFQIYFLRFNLCFSQDCLLQLQVSVEGWMREADLCDGQAPSFKMSYLVPSRLCHFLTIIWERPCPLSLNVFICKMKVIVMSTS